MTRNRASARAAGTRMETLVARYLAEHLDDRIERRRLTGSRDRGDIAGVRCVAGRVVVEVKDHGGRVLVGPWLEEARVEAGNDDAAVGVVVAKRRGRADAGDQIVLMSLRDLVLLLGGDA